MNILDNIINENPYKFHSNNKKKFFFPNFLKLIKYHIKRSVDYKKIINHFNFQYNLNSNIEDFPYIPVRIFKKFNLKSINDNEVYRTLYSSGTSGTKVSKILLDKKNSKDQINILSKLTSNIIGNKRLPMLIIDQPVSKNTKNIYSARMVGITGFSIFGKDLTFAFNENMEINFNIIKNFLNKYKNQEIIIFGFTSIFWNEFIEELIKRKIKLDVPKSIIIHGGGWKKLDHKNLSNKIFKQVIQERLNSKRIINYYGMVEQTGSIFLNVKRAIFILLILQK